MSKGFQAEFVIKPNGKAKCIRATSDAYKYGVYVGYYYSADALEDAANKGLVFYVF